MCGSNASSRPIFRFHTRQCCESELQQQLSTIIFVIGPDSGELQRLEPSTLATSCGKKRRLNDWNSLSTVDIVRVAISLALTLTLTLTIFYANGMLSEGVLWGDGHKGLTTPC